MFHNNSKNWKTKSPLLKWQILIQSQLILHSNEKKPYAMKWILETHFWIDKVIKITYIIWQYFYKAQTQAKLNNVLLRDAWMCDEMSLTNTKNAINTNIKKLVIFQWGWGDIGGRGSGESTYMDVTCSLSFIQIM